MKLELIRTDENEECTLGWLFVDGVPLYAALELPWKNNERNVSRIPAGLYDAALHHSPKFGLCVHVMEVPGRSEILIHAGNKASDTRGCILIGKKHSSIGEAQAVLNSRAAMRELCDSMQEVDAASLRIVDAF